MSTPSGPVYHVDRARTPEQLRRMQELAAAGECVFCPPRLADPSDPDLLEALAHWVIRRNTFPYEGTALHLLLVPRAHVRDLVELPADARAEFWTALDLVHQRFGLEHYSVAVRSGDGRFTGSTVEHLHVHLVVGDVEDPDHEPVRFKLSSRPSS